MTLAKLYSTRAGIENRIAALHDHFDEKYHPYDYVKQVQEGHPDEGKYVLYIATSGSAKSVHLVPGPFVEIDSTWVLLPDPPIPE